MSEYGYIYKWFDKTNKFYNIALKQFKFYKRVLGTKVRVSRIMSESKYRSLLGPVYTSNNLKDEEVLEFDYIVLLNLNDMKSLYNRNSESLEFYDDLNPMIYNRSYRFLTYKIDDALVYNINHNLGYYPEVVAVSDDGYRVNCHMNYPDQNSVQLIFHDNFSGTAYIDPYQKQDQELIYYNNLDDSKSIEIDLENGCYELIIFRGSEKFNYINHFDVQLIGKNKIKLTARETGLYRIYLTESKSSNYNEIIIKGGEPLIHELGGAPNFKIYSMKGKLLNNVVMTDNTPDISRITNYMYYRFDNSTYALFEDNEKIFINADGINNHEYLVTWRGTDFDDKFFRLTNGDLLSYERAGKMYQFKITNTETFSEAANVLWKYEVVGLHEVTDNKVW